jgi:hypothetical protein
MSELPKKPEHRDPSIESRFEAAVEALTYDTGVERWSGAYLRFGDHDITTPGPIPFTGVEIIRIAIGPDENGVDLGHYDLVMFKIWESSAISINYEREFGFTNMQAGFGDLFSVKDDVPQKRAELGRHVTEWLEEFASLRMRPELPPDHLV